eukprot:m.141236 g.141236  ORF g.141236 m.141236 type:complete len:140 (+) comp38335_c0_seq17:710-1129(+)
MKIPICLLARATSQCQVALLVIAHREKQCCHLLWGVIGTGCLIKAISIAAEREPIYMGKPQRPMFDILQAKYGIDPKTTCMIGDRVLTDIAFGQKNGLKTLLVMTGSTKAGQLTSLMNSTGENVVKPDFYLDSISQLTS